MSGKRLRKRPLMRKGEHVVGMAIFWNDGKHGVEEGYYIVVKKKNGEQVPVAGPMATVALAKKAVKMIEVEYLARVH